MKSSSLSREIGPGGAVGAGAVVSAFGGGVGKEVCAAVGEAVVEVPGGEVGVPLPPPLPPALPLPPLPPLLLMLSVRLSLPSPLFPLPLLPLLPDFPPDLPLKVLDNVPGVGEGAEDPALPLLPLPGAPLLLPPLPLFPAFPPALPLKVVGDVFEFVTVPDVGEGVDVPALPLLPLPTALLLPPPLPLLPAFPPALPLMFELVTVPGVGEGAGEDPALPLLPLLPAFPFPPAFPPLLPLPALPLDTGADGASKILIKSGAGVLAPLPPAFPAFPTFGKKSSSSPKGIVVRDNDWN